MIATGAEPFEKRGNFILKEGRLEWVRVYETPFDRSLLTQKDVTVDYEAEDLIRLSLRVDNLYDRVVFIIEDRSLLKPIKDVNADVGYGDAWRIRPLINKPFMCTIVIELKADRYRIAISDLAFVVLREKVGLWTSSHIISKEPVEDDLLKYVLKYSPKEKKHVGNYYLRRADALDVIDLYFASRFAPAKKNPDW